LRHLRGALSRQAWWLLLISGVFGLSVGLSNTFVNIYLWKVDKSYGAIGWYNLLVYFTLPLAFICAGWIARRLHTVWTLRMGVALHAVFYALTLMGGLWIAERPALLGAVMGLAGGFYWFSFNLLSLEFTAEGARERFYGLNGVLGAVAGMVAPPVAGFLISYEDRFGGLSGYLIVFGLSLGLFVVAVFFSARLRAQARRGKLHVRSALSALNERPWRMVLLGCMVYGFREGVFMFLIGLLLYLAIGSEFNLGKFFLLQSVLSFVSYYVVGRLVKPNNRLKVLGAGAVCMALTAMLFLLPTRPWVILTYGSIISLVLPFFLVPLQGFIFDGISQINPSGEDHLEHVIMREVFENAGRVGGIVGFLGLVATKPTAAHVSYFALTLGFFQLGTWWLLSRRNRNTRRSSRSEERTTRDIHRFPYASGRKQPTP
jgi:MFS transporter, YQGE family, putative transporter